MIGLDLALAFSRARWMEALDKAFRENKITGDISEKTALEVETCERNHQALKEAKRERT